MSDEDYDQGFAEGYYQGLSTDKETSFILLAARIDELKKENEKLRAALDCFLEQATPTQWRYSRERAEKLAKGILAAAALKETVDE